MELTTVDYVLAGLLAGLAVIGLFKGLSGWLGTIAGLAAAFVVAPLLFATCIAWASGFAFLGGAFLMPVAVIIDFVLSLIVFGLVRKIVVKFVSALLPQPFNALVGAASGLLLGSVVVVLLAGTAFFEGGSLQNGFVAAHSRIVHFAAQLIDAHLEGSRP